MYNIIIQHNKIQNNNVTCKNNGKSTRKHTKIRNTKQHHTT